MTEKKLITNLFKLQFSDTQMGTLIIGLKFATGLPKNDITDFIIKKTTDVMTRIPAKDTSRV